MHQDVRSIVDELGAALLRIDAPIHEPPGEQRGEHAAGVGVPGLLPPDVQTPGVYRIGILLGTGIEIIDVRGDRIAVVIDDGYPADDPVPHDRSDPMGVQPLVGHLTGAFRHTPDRQSEIFVGVHLDPAGSGIPYRRLMGRLCDAFHRFIVDGDLDALCSRIEAEIVPSAHVIGTRRSVDMMNVGGDLFSW